MSLELREIHKHFGPVRANDGINLTVAEGALHGLLGENGAGKSTLMKVLSGFHSADSGEIVLDGKPIKLASPSDAIAAGIGMLHQDPLVFLPFSVIDNFVLGSPGPIRLDRSTAVRELNELSGRYGFNLDPTTPARLLTVGERQQLEILRLLWLGARVLILDEPTTGISADQRAKLFATLKALAKEGMSVIFVSHKLEEVAELCHRVTVITRGKVVGHAELPTPHERLVEMMFGQAIEIKDRDDVPLGDPNLQLGSVRTDRGLLSEESISLDVREGEVIGLAGMEGSGQDTFLRICAGMMAPKEGSVRIGGDDLTGRHYHDYLDRGVSYVPAGRLEEGLIEGVTITEHFVLTGNDDSFFVDWRAARQRAEEHIDLFTIKGTEASTAESLSGGNQQRLLLAMLPPKLKVLLMEHPTRGLDIESADWVWGQLLARRADGTSIVFASADLDELLRYSDRILVFFSGRVIGTLDAATASVEDVGLLIGGRRRRDSGADQRTAGVSTEAVQSPQDTFHGRSGEKTCPACAETVKSEALVCRYCGYDFHTRSRPVEAQVSGLAVAALVLGILWLYGVGSVLAVIFGISARRQIRQSRGSKSGAGIAMAGLVLGWVGVASLVALIALLAAS